MSQERGQGAKRRYFRKTLLCSSLHSSPLLYRISTSVSGTFGTQCGCCLELVRLLLLASLLAGVFAAHRRFASRIRTLSPPRSNSSVVALRIPRGLLLILHLNVIIVVPPVNSKVAELLVVICLKREGGGVTGEGERGGSGKAPSHLDAIAAMSTGGGGGAWLGLGK